MSVLGGIGLDQGVRAFSAGEVGDKSAGRVAGRTYGRLLAAGGLLLLGIVTPLAYYALLTTPGDDVGFLRGIGGGFGAGHCSPGVAGDFGAVDALARWLDWGNSL